MQSNSNLGNPSTKRNKKQNTLLDIYDFIQADFSNVCFLALLSIHHRFRRNKIRKSVTWMPSIDINYSNTSPIHWMDEVKILVILCCCVTKFILACIVRLIKFSVSIVLDSVNIFVRGKFEWQLSRFVFYYISNFKFIYVLYSGS
jgi:hypothetical protein